MDLIGDTTGAVWNPANHYYPLQFQFIAEATNSFSLNDFDGAFSNFNKLYVLTAPFLSNEPRRQLYEFFRGVSAKLRKLEIGQRTRQKDIELQEVKASHMAELYDLLLVLMDQLKKHGLLNWYSVKDQRSIAERNNK